MKKSILLLFVFFLLTIAHGQNAGQFRITKQALRDKIMGGWAGQTIGVTFGGPYEFQFNGTFIGDYQPLKWYDGYLKKTMLTNPGLYDDLYVDLTFVDVFEKYGLNAPVDSFAQAFARSGYALWHANQAARYNLLFGMSAPLSGHWTNNPHADCIDYQIEADFAGLMSPGMPNVASEISDRIGHIMNYGDGWYGGVYIGAMYSLSFLSNDVKVIVTDALKSIPEQSDFYKCIDEVIRNFKRYPTDWKRTWLEVQRNWADDIGCPEGVFVPFNIDAKVNAAYVVIGLLYGNGDFTKTLEITTRCGQDADCNPSSSGGILGTILGYKKIPAYWKMGLAEAESIDFKYTTMSLADVYETGLEHALQNIKQHGGTVNGEEIIIKTQSPVPVRLEQSFTQLFPIEKKTVTWSASKDTLRFDFTGTGFVIRGETAPWMGQSAHVFRTELWLDGKLIESPLLPASFTTRRYELCWKYGLPKGKHNVELRILNPVQGENVKASEAIIYSDAKVNGITINQH
ncbi:MAG: ADP-ribosylglycohydrolase family protein [Chitinophagaceae bacterium]|nr:ADP-ribosylglycohydrolase family protein [Chitinophagaceae bacterium]